MTAQGPPLEVYLEVGTKRVLAGALAWPGWCRAGRDEASALRALAEAGPRYANILMAAGIAPPHLPALAGLAVVERLSGTATTDFGAPDVAPSFDVLPLDEAELARLQALLWACWAALDAAAHAAEGATLRRGPRGGGRDREGILRHVLESERSYLAMIGGRAPKQTGEELSDSLARTRQIAIDALAAAARGEVPPVGPRGGARWRPRYFVRRVAWHALDHAWEIEERAEA